jgi:plasmid segregation protein ParM
MTFVQPVVRAIDVGYGHIKFSDGTDPATKTIRTDSIPSQSPGARHNGHKAAGVMKQRDTFIVPVGKRRFEVGRQINLALHGSQETEVMDENFALSDDYAARLFGAINYMSVDGVIDILVLGLPLNLYLKHKQELEERFAGTHVINDHGDKISIKQCHVYPQPLGSYMTYMFSKPENTPEKPLALSIDVGYNTVDWFVCQGMFANDARSGAVTRGMGAVLRAIAEELIRAKGYETSTAEMIRAIDVALTTGQALTRYGKQFDFAPFLGAGDEVIHEATQAVRNSVGAGADIDVIILTGGGASLYAKGVAEKFPHHEVVTLDEPAQANVRGFHLIGEMLARSLTSCLQTKGQAA